MDIDFNTKEFNSSAQEFLTRVLSRLNSHILEKIIEVHHICFRCKTVDDYYLYKLLFENCFKLLQENEVKGRKICFFKLNESILFHNFKTQLLELTEPKIGQIYETGFEHIELLIDQPFEKLTFHFPSYLIWEIKENELRIQLEDATLKFRHSFLEIIQSP